MRNVVGGLIQMSNPINDATAPVAKIRDAMLEKHLPYIEEAGKKGVQILCLQEIFNGPYFCPSQDAKWYDAAEPIPGPTIELMRKLAKKHDMAIIVPIYEREMAGVYYNTAAVIDADGTVKGIYRKMHIPDDPAYYEKFYFTPGDLGFRAFDTAAGRIGALICWDQWYPEGARLTALQGAVILFYPTAIGWHPSEKAENGAAQLDAWRTVQRGHAIANGVYVAAVNRVGHEIPSDGGGPGASRGIEFWGHSFLCDPQGVVMAEAGEREEILLGEVDVAHLEDVRRNWPFLRDRRIDAYAGIDRRFLDK